MLNYYNMKYLLSICLTAFFLQVYAQHDIKIKIDGYEKDSLILGYYLGDKQLVHDTLISEKLGQFRLQADSTLSQGFYLFLTLTDNKFVQFIIDEDQEFEMSTSIDDLATVKFKGSELNEAFSDYIAFLGKQRPEADKINKKINELEEEDPDREKLAKELDNFDAKVKEEQQKIIDKYPGTLLSMLIKANTSVDLPKYEDEDPETAKIKTFKFYREHYFDNVEMGNPLSLRTPFLDQRVNYYIDKLTPQHPDSISASLDFILRKVRPAPETFRFYLSTFLNKYAKSKIVGMDAVFVHLADRYYAAGDAPWMDTKTLNKIQETAAGMRPVLIGKTAKDVELYYEDGSPLTLDDIEYEHLVILFWAPDCGHCKKAMPSIIEFYDNYKDKGVKLLSVCSKHGEKTKTCWPHIKEKGMEGFINVADTNHKSRFKIKYNVKTTPKIFILDKDKKIIMKNIGGEQLGDVMEEIYRREAAVKEAEMSEGK